MHNSREYLVSRQLEQEHRLHLKQVRVLLVVHDHGCDHGCDCDLDDRCDRIDHGLHDHYLMMEPSLLHRHQNLGSYLLASNLFYGYFVPHDGPHVRPWHLRGFLLAIPQSHQLTRPFSFLLRLQHLTVLRPSST